MALGGIILYAMQGLAPVPTPTPDQDTGPARHVAPLIAPVAGPRVLPLAARTIGIVDVDRGVKRWFERSVDAHVLSPQGDRRKVGFTFTAGERWAAAADRQGIRDRDGRLILPVISVQRVGFDQVSNRTALGTDTQGFRIARLVAEKTADLANLDLSRPISERRLRDSAVYDIYTIPFPRRGVLSYKVTVQAQYQSHINEIVEKISSRFDFTSVPSFVIGLGDHEPVATGRGSTEKRSLSDSSFDERRGPTDFYTVGYLDGQIGDEGNMAEFTDQERIIQVSFAFSVPIVLLLDPEGTAPAVRVERTAFRLALLDEEVHFVDRPEDLDLIFGSKK